MIRKIDEFLANDFLHQQGNKFSLLAQLQKHLRESSSSSYSLIPPGRFSEQQILLSHFFVGLQISVDGQGQRQTERQEQRKRERDRTDGIKECLCRSQQLLHRKVLFIKVTSTRCRKIRHTHHSRKFRGFVMNHRTAVLNFSFTHEMSPLDQGLFQFMKDEFLIIVLFVFFLNSS